MVLSLMLLPLMVLPLMLLPSQCLSLSLPHSASLSHCLTVPLSLAADSKYNKQAIVQNAGYEFLCALASPTIIPVRLG